MIGRQDLPAKWRQLEVPVCWNKGGTDLHPETERLVEEIRNHDRRFRAALASSWHGCRDLHLLYDRWVHLQGVLDPLTVEPFEALAAVCEERGLGLSAAFVLGLSADDAETLPAIGHWLTRIEVVLSPSTALPDAVLLQAVDRLARSRAAVLLCGDIDRYRRMGATTLPSLCKRPHEFRPR